MIASFILRVSLVLVVLSLLLALAGICIFTMEVLGFSW